MLAAEIVLSSTAIDLQQMVVGCDLGTLTIWKISVRRKVALGDTFGRTANIESPTRPRVTLLTAFRSTERPSIGATTVVSQFE